MAKKLFIKKLEAIELRKQGNSYSQIKAKLQVSKSSLSLWLRNYPLSDKRIRELRDWSEQRIEKFRNTMREKRETRLNKLVRQSQKNILPLSKKELFIAGLMLYWGEGAKTTPFVSSLSNTNPEIIKFFLYWLDEIMKVPKKKIVVRLHLYEDMDVNKEISYWHEVLDIPVNQFKSPYIKKTTLKGLTYKSFGHGTCNIIIYGRDIIEKIMCGIKAISGRYPRVNESAI